MDYLKKGKKEVFHGATVVNYQTLVLNFIRKQCKNTIIS
jgi:hypothetical protein